MKGKTLLFVAALALQSNMAQADPIRWQGILQYTGKSGPCIDDPTGGHVVVRFRPPLADNPDNGSDSRFSLFFRHSAESYVLKNGVFTRDFQPVESMTIGDGFGPLDIAPQVRFITMQPKNVKKTTPFILITGQILHWDSVENCKVNFTMNVTQRLG